MRQRCRSACHAGIMHLSLDATEILIGGLSVLIVVFLSSFISSRVGRRELRARLGALASRLGEDPSSTEKGSIDHVLSRLEVATDAAAAAVGESSADAIRLRRTLDRLPQGVLICDELGGVVFRNVAAVELVGGNHFDAIASQAVEDLLAANVEDRAQSERVLELYGPPRRTLSLRCVSVDDGQRSLGIVVVIDDITKNRRLEEVRRDFVANVSHELKTPMGALGLLAETLAVEPDPDVAQRLAGRIQSEAFRASRIIDDLLDLSRIEAEESPFREAINVSLIMAESLERVKSLAEQNTITLEISEPIEPITVLGDRRQLVSAFHNLLENAVKYSDSGGTVRFGATLNDDEVAISVSDDGVGIPSKELDRIFERFYRVDHGRSRATGGTGLGLSIVRHVASNHSGAIEVVSEEGVGSTFTFRIPIAPDTPVGLS